MASGNPPKPSTQAMRMSGNPRFFSSVRMSSQNLAPSCSVTLDSNSERTPLRRTRNRKHPPGQRPSILSPYRRLCRRQQSSPDYHTVSPLRQLVRIAGVISHDLRVDFGIVDHAGNRKGTHRHKMFPDDEVAMEGGQR